MKNVRSIPLLIIVLFFLFNKNVNADLREDAKTNTCEDLIKNGVIDKNNGSLLFTPTYDVNCIYYKSQKKSCSIFQLSFDSTSGDYSYQGIAPVEYFIGTSLIRDEAIIFVIPTIKVPFVGIILTYKKVENSDLQKFKGGCPVGIRVNFSSTHNEIGQFVLNDPSPNMSRLYATSIDVDIPSLITPKPEVEELKDCKDILGEDGVNFLKIIYNLIRIAVPIILLALGSLDFAQAVFSSNEDGIKKAQTKFIKRLIISICVFLIPVLLKMVLGIAHSIWPVIDSSLCGILE